MNSYLSEDIYHDLVDAAIVGGVAVGIFYLGAYKPVTAVVDKVASFAPDVIASPIFRYGATFVTVGMAHLGVSAARKMYAKW